MSTFLSVLASGVALGMVAALAALGTVLLYKATGVVNFATGDQVTLGAYLAIYATGLGWGVGASYAFAIAAVALSGVAIERLVYRPVRDRSPYVTVIATLGVALAMRAMLGRWQGSDPKALASPVGDGGVSIGGALIAHQRLLIVGVGAAAIIGLSIVFTKTSLGRQLRALAVDREMAQLMGVQVERLSIVVWALSGVLAASAGILIAPLVPIDLSLGFGLMIAAFAAAIVGGFTSFGGVTLGAIGLALSEQMLGQYLFPNIREAYPLILLVLVVAVRPQGLFTKAHAHVRV